MSIREADLGDDSPTAVLAPNGLNAAPPRDPAAGLLDEAKMIVTGARRAAYGQPEDNFRCIADLWTTYLNRREYREITPGDVAIMMILMKTARLAESPKHHDSAVDIAGYAACLARCQEPL